MKKKVAVVAKSSENDGIFGFPVTFFCAGEEVWIKKNGNGLSIACSFNATISVDEANRIMIDKAGKDQS